MPLDRERRQGGCFNPPCATREVLCAAPGSVFLSTWLRSRVNLGVPANIDARIGHLAESKSAALEHAHAAAGTAAGEHPVSEELLRCVIPQGQTLEGHQYRTHLRLKARSNF